MGAVEIAEAVLALALKLYPDIAALVKGAPAGALGETTTAAVNRILPDQSESAKAAAELAGK